MFVQHATLSVHQGYSLAIECAMVVQLFLSCIGGLNQCTREHPLQFQTPLQMAVPSKQYPIQRVQRAISDTALNCVSFKRYNKNAVLGVLQHQDWEPLVNGYMYVHLSSDARLGPSCQVWGFYDIRSLIPRKVYGRKLNNSKRKKKGTNITGLFSDWTPKSHLFISMETIDEGHNANDIHQRVRDPFKFQTI